MPDYRGAPETELVELGKLAIEAAMVEEMCRWIAEALGLPPTNDGFSATARSVRKKVQTDGVPAWSRTSAGEICRWLEKAFTLMDERNAHLHAVTADESQNGAWRRIAFHRKTGAFHVREVPSIARTVDKLYTLWFDAGMNLVLGMLVEMRRGVYLKRYVHPGLPGVINTHQDGSWPDRATPEEIDAFWDEWESSRPPT